MRRLIGRDTTALDIPAKVTVKEALARSSLGSTREYDPDARLYAGACLGCHYNAGPTPLAVRPELALNTIGAACHSDFAPRRCGH
jgi:hypothetical protein